MTSQMIKYAGMFVALAATGISAQAASWSDTSIGYRTGSD